jgi:uncharacterized protein HemY
MIEILLQAERALTMGLMDQAERLYRQAADADPHNSIAVVGLARVALERGDEPAAWRQARRALEIDPENVAAQRLAGRLEEVWAYRGESLPEVAMAEVAEVAEAERAMAEAAAPTTQTASETSPTPETTPDVPAPLPPDRGVMDRLLRRNRP